jgi:misacylated tRNA(Ala) deacylase
MRLRPNGDDGVFCFLEDTMTELLYTTDAYVQTFDAVVTAVTDDNGVILDRTAFYPGGGGQPNDEGTLAAGDQTWQVTRVKKVGGEVVHFVAGALPGVGTAVTGQLDWERRYLSSCAPTRRCTSSAAWSGATTARQVTGGNMDPLRGAHGF